MNLQDFEQLKEYLRNNLTVSVESGYFTDPNTRVVTLSLDGEEFSRASFDVVQKPEYEG